MAMYDKEDAKRIYEAAKSREEFIEKLRRKYPLVKISYAAGIYNKLKYPTPKNPRAPKPAVTNQATQLQPSTAPQTESQIGTNDIIEEDINITAGPELKQDSVNIQKGFANMLDDFDIPIEDVENSQGGSPGQEDLKNLSGGAGTSNSSSDSQNNSSQTEKKSAPVNPYQLFYMAGVGIDDNLLYPERKLTDEEREAIRVASEQMQAKRLGFLNTDPNADIYNYILATGVGPMVSRLDLVGKRVIEFFNFIRQMSGKNPINAEYKDGKWQIKPDAQQHSPPNVTVSDAHLRPQHQAQPQPAAQTPQTATKTPQNEETTPAPTDNPFPNETITPTVKTVPVNPGSQHAGARDANRNPVFGDVRDDIEGDHFDPTDQIDYAYYVETGKLRNKTNRVR